MMWGIWGWIFMIGFCLLLVFFIKTTIFLTIGTYKETKAGVYGDWSMMLLTSIPISLSILSMYALYYLLIKSPFWLN